MDDNELNCWLARFISEVCSKNKSEYPPKTLYLIACGLLRHLRDNGIYDKNILDEKDSRFKYFTNALDGRMKDLTYRGIGLRIKQSDIFTEAEELFMWANDIFGNDSSEVLQYTLYFYNSKLFGLRGREEHHDLNVTDFCMGSDSDGRKFIEYTSRRRKNSNGGLRQRHFETKIIRHYDTDGKRSVISLYDEYFKALENKEGPFYMRTLPNIMNSIRFGKQRVGVNTLGKVMSILAARANLKGNFTSHSGKATCGTRLAENGIDDKMIKKRLGNRSCMGLESYKRSRADDYRTSDVLNPPLPSVEGEPAGQTSSQHEMHDVHPNLYGDVMEKGLPPQVPQTSGKSHQQVGPNVYNNCNFYIF